ncbi:3622_t:CDS:2, partial [Funneliformis geosporum]
VLAHASCLHSYIRNFSIFGEYGGKGVLFNVEMNICDIQGALLKLHIFFVFIT